LVEPEVVATSPYPIKSRVPVCCGFSSRKNGGRERTCTSKAHRLSICGVFYSLLTTRPKNIEQNWSLQPVLLRQEFFTKEIRRLLRGGGNWPVGP